MESSIKLWLKSLFIYLWYEQYDLTPEIMSKPYLPGRNSLICETRTMKNVEFVFLNKLMCWHIKMANEIQFYSKPSDFRKLLPREFLASYLKLLKSSLLILKILVL